MYHNEYLIGLEISKIGERKLYWLEGINPLVHNGNSAIISDDFNNLRQIISW